MICYFFYLMIKYFYESNSNANANVTAYIDLAEFYPAKIFILNVLVVL